MVKMASSKVRGEREPALVMSLRMVKLAFQLGRRRVKTGGVSSSPAHPRAAKTARFPRGYVEDCGESRTTLGDQFHKPASGGGPLLLSTPANY